MKPEWLKVLREMRETGHAVVVWTPEELGDVAPREVEDEAILYVNEYLINQGESK